MNIREARVNRAEAIEVGRKEMESRFKVGKAKGLTYKEIAVENGVAESVVRRYLDK